MIRMLKTAKDSAVKARTQAVNQMKALVVTAPAELRETLDGLTATALAARCKSFRPGRLEDPTAAAKYTLRSLAYRYLQLDKEIRDLRAELERLTKVASPALVSIFGIGPDTAAALLISAGSNPQRIHSEAAFASLYGVSPVPASSGKTNRHRLNRGGDRQANAALYRVVLVRLSHELRTREYMDRRTREGMGKTRSSVVSNAMSLEKSSRPCGTPLECPILHLDMYRSISCFLPTFVKLFYQHSCEPRKIRASLTRRLSKRRSPRVRRYSASGPKRDEM